MYYILVMLDSSKTSSAEGFLAFYAKFPNSHSVISLQYNNKKANYAKAYLDLLGFFLSINQVVCISMVLNITKSQV